MLDAKIGLSPLAPIALDLGRTDGLSTQTPIDMSIEFVVVCERPCTERTLAHRSRGGCGR
jgi:hypothetical protein